MKVTYKRHMGDDLLVVDAARVSFAKESDWVCSCGEFDAWVHDYDYEYYCGSCGNGDDLVLPQSDTKLINYLASHNHWTPFAHPQICLHMKLPMFVQRQIDKHQTGFVVNEVSRRYVSDTPEFYTPTEWRKAPTDGAKQGSSSEPVDWITIPSNLPAQHFENCKSAYEKLLAEGAAPEMARMVLPMSMYTESYKTGSLYGWANLYNLRIDSHAQKEVQEVAKQVGEILQPLFPVSWEELTGGKSV